MLSPGGASLAHFSALYQAFHAGQEPALPAPLIQYADYAAWQRNWLQGEVLQAQLNPNIQLVSGATDTSHAFLQSLQAAILLAKKA